MPFHPLETSRHTLDEPPSTAAGLEPLPASASRDDPSRRPSPGSLGVATPPRRRRPAPRRGQRRGESTPRDATRPHGCCTGPTRRGHTRLQRPSAAPVAAEDAPSPARPSLCRAAPMPSRAAASAPPTRAPAGVMHHPDACPRGRDVARKRRPTRTTHRQTGHPPISPRQRLRGTVVVPASRTPALRPGIRRSPPRGWGSVRDESALSRPCQWRVWGPAPPGPRLRSVTTRSGMLRAQAVRGDPGRLPASLRQELQPSRSLRLTSRARRSGTCAHG